MSYKKPSYELYLGESNDILLEETGYDAIMLSFIESIDELSLEKDKLFSADMTAESACPNNLNDILGSINENIENNYQYVTNVLTSTYNHLVKHERNVERIDSEAANNGKNREEVM